jgi:hypothetical protein
VSPASTEWAALPFEAWRATCETLHLWTQVVGKIRLAQAPPTNHWWDVALYVTPRGLSTSSIAFGSRTLDITFDLRRHRLLFETSDGRDGEIPLEPLSVADFYARVMDTVRSLGFDVRIWPRPVEVVQAIPFPDDRAHASYDREAVGRFHGALVQADRVLKVFRARFRGKSSPVHFFWGSFDLAVTRFSGRAAPPHPGGIPNLADRVTREAYSDEVISCGWWPGSAAFPEPAFYAYAYPEPPGLGAARIEPAAASYHPELREFVLPYDAVRESADPDATALAFFQSTYDGAASLAEWDRVTGSASPSPGPR